MMHLEKELTPKERFLKNLSLFLEKHYRLLIGLLIVIILGGVGIFILDAVNSNQAESNNQQVEDLEGLVADWNAAEEEAKPAISDEIISSADLIVASNPHSIYALRALFTRAQLYSLQELWETAAEDFTSAYESDPETYLGAIALFNAATAYENAGQQDKAIELYQEVVNNEFSYDVPHAYFSLGRIYEDLEEREKALEYYELIQEEYASSDWTKLAVNRIIRMN